MKQTVGGHQPTAVVVQFQTQYSSNYPAALVLLITHYEPALMEVSNENANGTFIVGSDMQIQQPHLSSPHPADNQFVKQKNSNVHAHPVQMKQTNISTSTNVNFASQSAIASFHLVKHESDTEKR